MSSPVGPVSPVVADLDLAEVQRHTVRTLLVSQAVGAVGVTIGVTTASLLARDISGSETMAGPFDDERKARNEWLRLTYRPGTDPATTRYSIATETMH